MEAAVGPGTSPGHRCRATRLSLAVCLLLGAGFLIKPDATGMLAAKVLGRVSRAPAPVMQYQPPVALATPVAQEPPVLVAQIQGETLRTWEFKSSDVEKVQVDLGTESRPLEATVEVWNSAGNTPFQARVYSEDGEIRPLSAVVQTPRGPSTVAIRNIGQAEFPMSAKVDQVHVQEPSGAHPAVAQIIQGGALKTFPMEETVEAVEVLLSTNGMPMNARVEILQGPDTNKQVIELYTEDGLDRPFFCTIATPWSSTVVRVLNTGPVEYPLIASVVPTAHKASVD